MPPSLMRFGSSIPSSYVHALECFIAAKQEYLCQYPSAARALTTMYDYQRKYINTLIKQLPPGTMYPAASRSVLMHPPTIMKNQPLRQGPFLLQPSPRHLVGSEGGDATDIIYLSFGNGEDDEDGETERLGVILIAFQDGKVDLCLDVEKVEARWELKQVQYRYHFTLQHFNTFFMQESDRDLPMLAVYETIDLGIVSTLSQYSVQSRSPLLDLLQGNHPVFLPDPIHEDAVYVYHAFGVHGLYLGVLLQSLAVALREADNGEGAALDAALQKIGGSSVQPILNSYSVERQ
jgi:nucleoporin NUP82